MNRNQLHYLLINVPLTDPTAPYHSLSYLVGAGAHAGYTSFSCLDANIEALNFLAQPGQVADLLQECADVRSALEHTGRLTRGDQLVYRYALKAVGLQPDSVVRAIRVMTDPNAFYDYGMYRQAVMVLKRWMDVLSVRGFAGQFDGFSLGLSHTGNLAGIGDLTDPACLDRLVRPFAPYFSGPFLETLRSRDWRLVGLSVNYISQLPLAIFMARLIRAVLPDAVLCVGGTEISDDVKCLRDPGDIWRLFPDCDAVVVGEGETALVDILDTIAEGTPLPGHRPGILLRDALMPLTKPPVNYENLATLPPPRYDIWDLDQYWSPEPVVLYSPTRGCYWNKCTFCDYGLNTDLPTSPSRNKPIEAVVEELRDITRLARTIYLSVDAIAPAYLRRLAQAIAANGLGLQWSAELRLEKTFLRGMVQELRDSGCVAISFGYESGSQRILDLIDKGVRLEQVPELLRELARAGIAAQMMGFIGFPGEMPGEARATYEFLLKHQDHWTLAGIGDFVLTPGAAVAKRYPDFGITAIDGLDGDDIVRMLYWVDGAGVMHGPGDMRSPAIDEVAEKIVRFADDRPFVGGIDSSHSILYFGRYGPSLVPAGWDEQPVGDLIVTTERYTTPLSGVEDFTHRADVAEYHRRQHLRGRSPGFREVMDWLAEYPEQGAGAGAAGEVVEIYPGGLVVTLTAERAEIERRASPAYQLMKELLLRETGVA